ncbi:Ribosomal RNA large subunit methyltransferase E [Tepidimonas alkaliphilus]|uniref:Ribosomal RNA large subunit methyltransferase E n=1 Tax=Tepidimonas alkaliphilus TaxID=2588942 RepID=A0A554WDI0_9BURK|nr:RlmE family RNA methyltransferase [Tepidimonas alkaliphilus]TSE21597.1 Ribosomal RNA large subunit methyltransferase E [Tepidimonas alkaliphilus]
MVKVRTKSKKVDKAWFQQHVTDPWVRRAQQEGYRARAAYKLQELDEAFHLVRPGQVIVDLGCAPGAWSQYLRRRLGTQPGPDGRPRVRGVIVGVDLLPVEPIDGVHLLQGDFREEATLQALQAALRAALGAAPERAVDLVVSDMAPNLSGIEEVDAARIEHLVELAADFALRHLKPDGALVVKVFHGGAYDAAVRLLRQHFQTVKAHKPKASRPQSAETFLVARGLRA